MTVIPHRSELFQSCQEVYQFLAFCQQQSIRDQHPKIVSLTTEIGTIDPLVLLHHFARADQLHFYFENPHKQEAMVAIDAAVCHVGQVGQPHRFSCAKQFVQDTAQHIISHDSDALPICGPRFFGGFTFFADAHGLSPIFPPATLFLPRWQIARHQDTGILVANAMVSACVDIADLAESIWQQWQHIQRLATRKVPTTTRQLQPSLKPVESTCRFKQSVRAAIATIEAQDLHKIVLAHAVDVTAEQPFSPTRSLQNLRQHYPGCYIFSMSNGKGHSFIGASPERLISVHHGELVTDALAGSAPRSESVAADSAIATHLRLSEKERHEHRVVVDFITQKLTAIGLQPLSAAVPSLLRLSNIQHLHTPIRAKLPPTVHPLDILKRLHPTPAVAGVPRRHACREIRKYEAFERDLYAAPLGWLDPQGNCEFIVGIRSALIEGNRARLYAGAGIVAGSDPERELAEIQLKLSTLLNTLV